MNKLYFTKVVEKARGLFTSSQPERDRQPGRQTGRDRQTDRDGDRQRQRQTER